MNENKINAVLFDMDGLMLDTERISRQNWMQACKEWGYEFTREIHNRLIGRVGRDIEAIFKGIFGNDFPYPEVQERRTELTLAYYHREGIPLKPGLIELLNILEQSPIQRAIATSSYAPWAHTKLKLTGIDQRFETIVTGNQVQNGKPAPDIFLLAARKLGVLPSECMVLEDAEAGIRAAHAAGMIPVMIPDLVLPSPEIKAIAYKVLMSLYEVKSLLELNNLDGS